ncbi:hypothetical protein Tco_1186133 [Tanacetum coccineum]
MGLWYSKDSGFELNAYSDTDHARCHDDCKSTSGGLYIGRYNNYVVLHNIPCPVECKIVGKILIDHALSYALTVTADVLTVYIQQFWKTVKQVSNANNTIRFTDDRETITYTVDMFRSTLQLPVENPDNPFIEPSYLKFIQRFLKIVGYEGIVNW